MSISFRVNRGQDYIIYLEENTNNKLQLEEFWSTPEGTSALDILQLCTKLQKDYRLGKSKEQLLLENALKVTIRIEYGSM